jgi:hypothetical protein
VSRFDPSSVDKAAFLAGEQTRSNAAFSAAILREEVEEVLTEALAAPSPVFTIHPTWFVRRAREVAGGEAGRVCARLLSTMKNLTHSSSIGGVASLAAIRRGDLALMYELSRRLFILLGRDPLPEVSSRPGVLNSGASAFRRQAAPR